MKKDSWDEGTFKMEGKTVYNYISEERIREIVREEIVEYNKVFMSKIAPEPEYVVPKTIIYFGASNFFIILKI